MRMVRLSICLILLLLPACAEQRIEGASSFASSAITLQDSLKPLLDESFNAQLQVNSATLIEERDSLTTRKARLDKLKKQEALMAETFETTAFIKRQIDLLKSVFVALAALAQSDADTKISAATSALFAELDTVSKTAVKLNVLKDSKFSEQKDAIEKIIAKGATLAVAQFKSAAIRKFLESYGDTILKSLEIQEQLLSVIADRLEFYGTIDLKNRYFDEVAAPYAEGSAPNAQSWSAARLRHYTAKVNLERVEAAKTGSRNVRMAFVALSENRLTLDSISLIVADIARIQEFLSAVRTTTSKTGS